MPEPAPPAEPWDELRILREARGLRLADLAREAGLSRSYVWRLETGHRSAAPHIIKRLAEALAVPVTMLRRTA